MVARWAWTAGAWPWWTLAGVCRPRPLWRCWWLYQVKKSWQWARAASIEGNRAGNAGRYLRVLNCASEYGLSLLTWGRLWDWVTPRSASRNATGLDVIDEPRSAWMVSCPARMSCLAQVSAISFSARAADSQ